MPSGGPRTPSNPAPVSGPGPMSRRTDGGPGQPARYMSGGEYGEGQEMMALQQSAPMARTQATPKNAPMSEPRPPARQPIGLMEPTGRPDEPLTYGAPFGDGAGPEVTRVGTSQGISDADGQRIREHLPRLLQMADREDSPEGFKRFVRYLRDMG